MGTVFENLPLYYRIWILSWVLWCFNR